MQRRAVVSWRRGILRGSLTGDNPTWDNGTPDHASSSKSSKNILSIWKSEIGRSKYISYIFQAKSREEEDMANPVRIKVGVSIPSDYKISNKADGRRMEVHGWGQTESEALKSRVASECRAMYHGNYWRELHDRRCRRSATRDSPCHRPLLSRMGRCCR